jgi:hypothetical protein
LEACRSKTKQAGFFASENLWTESLGLAETRPPPYFRSITRLKPTRKSELFE